MTNKCVQNGGKREGAGRPKGSPNKATTLARQQVLDSGISPLQLFAQVYQDVGRDMGERLDAAKAASPYIHSKMPTDINLENTLDGNIDVHIIPEGVIQKTIENLNDKY